MTGVVEIPNEIKQFVEDANNAPAIHEGSLLGAMINPVSIFTKKAQEITERLS